MTHTAFAPHPLTTRWIKTALASPEWVDSTPFRAHLQYLVGSTGLHWRVVALFCGLPVRVAERLLAVGPGQRQPKRISHYCAARLLAVQPRDLEQTRDQEIASVQVTALLEGLVARGYSIGALARRVGAGEVELEMLLRRRWDTCSQLVGLQVNAIWNELVGTDEPEPGEVVRSIVSA